MEMELNLAPNKQAMVLLPTHRAMTKGESITYDTSAVTSFPMSGGLYDVNNSASNATNGTADYLERDPFVTKLEIAVLATILYLAIFGNGVVLLVLRLRHQKLTRMQCFIAHLALADLFMAFFNVLPQMVWDITVLFLGNDLLCRAVKYFQVVAMYATSYVLVMAAIDRYMSICHPLTSQTLSPKRVNLMIVLAWSLSLLFSLPQLFIFKMMPVEDGVYDCYAEFVPGWGMQAYITWIFISDYVIPFLFLAFCYGRICLVVWASVGAKENPSYSSVRPGRSDHKSFRLRILFRRMRDQPQSSLSSSDQPDPTSLIAASKKPRGHQGRVSRSKIKTIKLTLTVVLCYLFCWAPFFVVQMWMAYQADVLIENPVVVIIMLLASLNSCTNPWIYLAFSGCPCPKGPFRRTSTSRVPSTHLTSGGDSPDSRSRSSFFDLSHGRSHHPRPRTSPLVTHGSRSIPQNSNF